MTHTQIPGRNNGKHAGGILTTTAAGELSPELLRNEVDSRIVKLRPMATPIDQISRYAANRPAGSMTVEYYAVDTRAEQTQIMAEVPGAAGTATDHATVTLKLKDAAVFDVSETIVVPGVAGDDGAPVTLYVMEKTDEDTIKAITIYGIRNQWGTMDCPVIGAGKTVTRLGRAAGELDVQTPQFEALPRKSNNNCQIFKAQIEQSTLMRAANKEVEWTFSDQEEIAVYDMRLGMEKTFLFGHKARITDPRKKCEVFFTEGIWYQAGQSAAYPYGSLDGATWLNIMRTAFTGNAGSSRKILVAGSGLIEQLSMLDGGQQRVMLSNDVVTRWGLDFHEIHSKFGTLLVLMSEVFDICGHSDDGLIIDPEYITKYTHMPFSATTLDLRTSGQRNTDAVVMTEASCLVLRYPEAHTRITCEFE